MVDYGINKTARWTCYTAGAIFIFLGAMAILHPFWAVVSMAILMGLGFIFTGINNLVPYFTIKDNPAKPKWLLPLGVIDIFFGLFFISHIGLAIFTLSTMLGAWILLVAATRGVASFQLKKAGVDKWWVMLLGSVAMFLVGAILICNPIIAPVGAALFSGVSLISTGLLMIFEGKFVYPPKPKL